MSAPRKRRTVSRSTPQPVQRTVLDSLPIDQSEWIWVDDKTWERWQRALEAAARAQAEMDAAYHEARERRARLTKAGLAWVIQHDPVNDVTLPAGLVPEAVAPEEASA